MSKENLQGIADSVWMCFSGISGCEGHGDEVIVLVASLSTVVGDCGS